MALEKSRCQAGGCSRASYEAGPVWLITQPASLETQLAGPGHHGTLIKNLDGFELIWLMVTSVFDAMLSFLLFVFRLSKNGECLI